MKKVITVVNNDGIKFNVRLVEKGDSYGRGDCLIHDKEDSLVEFFDARFCDGRFEELGQFVSRYYYYTLLEVYDGLQLDCGVDAWVVSSNNMRDIREWILSFNLN